MNNPISDKARYIAVISCELTLQTTVLFFKPDWPYQQKLWGTTAIYFKFVQ